MHMNAPQPSRRPETSSEHRPALAAAAAIPDRHHHRERDFGVGYGNSSGYASARRYTDGHVDPLFRCR
jgi:trans-aconitate methyltransferase